jgi:predicted metal-binding transcription factor (methanogenesis marker protein 9)
MITIDGLTKEQVSLLDTMWDIDGYQEYMEWKEQLSTATRQEVEVLEQMITLAETDDVEDVELAKKVLANF